MDWKEELEEKFSTLSNNGGFLMRVSDYMPDLVAIEYFIQQLLDQRDEEIIGKLEEMSFIDGLEEQKVMLNEAISTIKDNK